MLYLEQTTSPQAVKIPRNLVQTLDGEYTLTLENTIDRSRISVTPSGIVTAALTYNVTLSLPDILPAGEYSYELRQGAAVLAVGVLTIGEYEHDTTQYHAGTTYEQYEG